VIDDMAQVLLARRGDEVAFTTLVEKYQKPVYNLCYRMLGEIELAEDAAQETFLKAFQNLARYDPERSFATWILSIAAHYCIDRLRRRKFGSFSLDGNEEGQRDIGDPYAVDPEAETIRNQTSERLQDCLQSLDPIDRAAVIMRYWQDCSEMEISQALRLTVPAVKSRLHRARLALADIWEEKEKKTQMRHERKPYGSPAF
jgi:RNA polymerase sigma-70 factor (ECF subfamily)